MTTSKKINLKMIIFLIFMIAWTGIIFSLSLQPAVVSSATSRGLLKKILFVFYSITKIKIEPALIHNLFRTFAHYSEFFVLGIFSLLFFFTSLKKRPIYAIIYGILISICDELIQHFFSEGRTLQLIDIIVDSSGVITASIIFYIIYKIICIKRNKKHNKRSS